MKFMAGEGAHQGALCRAAGGFHEAIFHPADMEQDDERDAYEEAEESLPSSPGIAAAGNAQPTASSDSHLRARAGGVERHVAHDQAGRCSAGHVVPPGDGVGRHVLLGSNGARVFAVLRQNQPEMVEAVSDDLLSAIGLVGGVRGRGGVVREGGEGEGDRKEVAWERGELVARLVRRADERVVGRVCEIAVSDAVRGIGLELD